MHVTSVPACWDLESSKRGSAGVKADSAPCSQGSEWTQRFSTEIRDLSLEIKEDTSYIH